MGIDVAEDEQRPAPQADPEAVTVLMLPGWSTNGDALHVRPWDQHRGRWQVRIVRVADVHDDSLAPR
jgi:hypothetical protein